MLFILGLMTQMHSIALFEDIAPSFDPQRPNETVVTAANLDKWYGDASGNLFLASLFYAVLALLSGLQLVIHYRSIAYRREI